MIHCKFSGRGVSSAVITFITGSSIFPPLRLTDFSGFLFFSSDYLRGSFRIPIFNLHQNFLGVQLGEPSSKSFGVRVKRLRPDPSTNIKYNLSIPVEEET